MRHILSAALILFICNIINAQTDKPAQNINTFSFKLFEVVNTGQENCFYSPYSIYEALSMTYEGAKDGTKMEMGKALEIGKGENVAKDFSLLSKQLKKNKDVKLLTANSIWIQETLKLKKSYSKLVKQYYGARCESVDFVNPESREKVRKEVNDWVKKETQKKIDNFLKKGILTEMTGMVLVNAVYFKALWETSFSKKDTKPDQFMAASGNKVDCNMMNSRIDTKYYTDDVVQAIELPYKNKSASMIVIMPKETSKAITSVVDYDYYNDILRSMQAKKVKLSFPKFKLDVDYDLSKTMKKLGMKSAFSSKADFSKITGGKDLTISNVLHRSVVEVGEEGTEAASVTAVIANRSAMVTKDIPVVFKADKPFLFIVKDNQTEAILFMGFLAQPSGVAKDSGTTNAQSRDGE